VDIDVSIIPSLRRNITVKERESLAAHTIDPVGGSNIRNKTAAFIVVAITCAFIICIWAGALFFLQPFGHRHWALGANGLLLSWVALRFRPFVKTPGPVPRRFERLFGRSYWLIRGVLGGALVCSLLLVGYSAAAPGGAIPAAPSVPQSIRVVTWNILVGSDDGPFWRRHGWPIRKNALKSALDGCRPDILCVQEARAEQLGFLAQALPGHERVGVGRDDGRAGGEHCAIFYNAGRFHVLASGTFWLEEPIDQPPRSGASLPKRICSWVRLHDRVSNQSLRVYNTHLYLTEAARLRAIRLILAQLEKSDPTEAIILTADFNDTPNSRSRRLLGADGLISSALLAGDSTSAPTYQFYGIRFRSLDEILVNHACHILKHHVIDAKPGNTYPSDHFGVLADVIVSDRRAVD
jgi:endonuclease/exonuclease/phosphatase family metal-dependent hydrolase